MRLQVAGLTMELGGHAVVSDATFSVEDGEIAGLVGPNGSGKSTMLRAIYRHLAPVAGQVVVGPDDVWALSARAAATRTAAVPQERGADVELTVGQVVTTGRTAHKRPFSADSEEDRRIVAGALERVQLGELAARPFSTLSGGEKQRALVARALAQQARVLVLDEPTNHLDVRHQLGLLELLAGLELTVFAALHDLNLAAAFCERIFVIDAGRIVAAGAPREVLTRDLLREVFGVEAHIAEHPRTGRPWIAFSR